MAEQTTIITHAETPDAFLADRQKFWGGFSQFVLFSVIFVALVLILMAIFLT